MKSSAGDFAPSPAPTSPRLAVRVYGVMAIVSLSTFATLAGSYQAFYPGYSSHFAPSA